MMAALANVTALRQQVEGLLAGTASDSGPVINSAGTPQPTILEETQPSQAGATGVPSLTDTAQPQNGNTATDMPGVGSPNPEPEPDHTPPGQVKKATPHVPPGQVKPDPSHQQSPKPTKPPK